ncbi:hypothetical protein [Actinomadura sp. NPDC048394]|uniref:hypothetical protein n=1 Tax=Actinomadura sp. NPDC048394 TaxID=3158223 RepID=UPI0033D81D6D
MTMMTDRDELTPEVMRDRARAQVAKTAAALASLVQADLPLATWMIKRTDCGELEGQILGGDTVTQCRASWADFMEWADHFGVTPVNPRPQYDRHGRSTFREIRFTYDDVRVRLYTSLPSPDVAEELGC